MMTQPHKSFHMVMECPPRAPSGKVRPHSDLHFVCQHYPVETFRVGIDFRGAQSGGGSGQRGIGRYATDLVLGLLEFGPALVASEFGKALEIVLFQTAGVPLPSEINGQVEAAPIEAPRWDSPNKPLWMKIPKVRSLPSLHQAHLERTIEAQHRAMSQQVQAAKLDVLHLPTALDVGSYPNLQANCPVVMTVLDTIILSLPEIGLNRYPKHLQWYYRNQILNLARANRLVTISEATKSDVVRQFGFDANTIDVVYPAVSTRFGEAHSAPTLGALDARPYFLFCSVPDPHKNPRQVIEAFSRLKTNHALVFVAPASHPESMAAQEYATSLGIGDRFILTGFVETEELYRLFKHATALVSPSQMEGFGLPVAQAMRAGTPVITSNNSAQAEIAARAGILVDPNSVDELSAAMEQVISNDLSDRVAMGVEDAKQFDPQTVTLNLLQSFKKALA